MPVQVERTEERLGVKLEGDVTIRHAQDLAVRLGEVLDGVASITVYTAGLEDIGTSILQVLCSLRKTVPVLSFENPSQAFIAAVDRCGLRRELLGPVEETA